MSCPDHLAPLFKAAQRLDGGIMMLDRYWKIVYFNAAIREIYPGFAILPDTTYDDLFWHCVNNGIMDSPEIYASPQIYLNNLKEILSIKSFNSRVCVHRNGCTYMMQGVPKGNDGFSGRLLLDYAAASGR